MDLRQFVFFDQADHVLFVRTDAEQAEWQVDELSLTCLFPYDPERLITRGMRIGFEDDDGNLQPFEVRKVRNYEPDATQELTCEHIVISELTDIHTKEAELTNASPSSALTTVLNNQPQTMTAKWLLGNVTATATSSGDIGMGSIWQNIRNIEQNWNVYILPRVTFNSGGITGRYLDIVPAEGVWHGLRLSLDKNADEAGVTIDDTEVKTALFGYGGTAYEINNEHTDPLDKSSTKITLVGYNWPGHPAGAEINSLQGYIVDTAATNNYGRNGQPRFGFYQNSDITDKAVLAQKTWEALQSTNKPRVTVDCMVRDLYRMGYHDEKIRLHDTALVELLPMNDVLQLEIIKLSVDLLDPTATRPTIGAYIPNIVYIQRQTAREASGGVSGKLSGRVGSSQTNTEAEWSEFIAGIDANNMLISLHAAQVDHDNNVLKAAGLDIDATTGVIIYAENNENYIGAKFKVQAEGISSLVTKTGVNSLGEGETLYSEITQNADKISLVVTSTKNPDTGVVTNSVNTASIILAINGNKQGDSSATIQADKIYLDAAKTVTVADVLYIANGGAFWVKRNAAFGSTGQITLNEGTLNAPTIQINSAGTLKFSPGSQTGSAISFNHAKAASIITGVRITGPTDNVYTLQYQSAGTGDTWNNAQVTFSRATTLSGAWSSGVFTVTATPQGNELKTSLTNTGHWGNPSVTPGEDENTYYYATKATIGTSATIYDTGNTTTISGFGRFNAGVTEGESHFSPAGRVYTRGTSAHYFGSAGTIYEAVGHVYLKLHTASETPTGSWYSVQSGSSGATLTLYTRSARTDLYVSGSGTAYYTSTGFSDNYYTYTG